MNATPTVQDICAAIAEHRLMSSKDFAAMRARWGRPGRQGADDPQRFLRWLVANRYVTEFVAQTLGAGKANDLVLNQFRVIDRLASGPMAGTYLAADPLDRHVAIEMLAADSASAPFQEAARRAMALEHPNVGRILDMGEAGGRRYLVKENYEGQTLKMILERRKSLPYAQAARLMALALAGVDALHQAGLGAGELSADCLLLTAASRETPHQRTVKVLLMGIHGTPNPQDDIFRLGCVFYRCLTGQAPFSSEALPNPGQPAAAVCTLAPHVPEMLGQIVDEMIDPVAVNRPKKAAHVAKSLRIFLAADEHGSEHAVDAQIAPPKAHVGHLDAVMPDDEPETRLPPGRRQAEQEEGARGKAAALWDAIRPEPRELVFLGGGALGVLLLILIFELITGLRFIYLAGLATGAAASYFVEMLLRWRRKDAVSSEG